jgi:hypothetical protein
MEEECDALEEKVAELERENRLLRVQYDRRVEERDAAKAQNAVLRAALEGMLGAYGEMINNPPYYHSPSIAAQVEEAVEALAKAKGGVG